MVDTTNDEISVTFELDLWPWEISSYLYSLFTRPTRTRQNWLKRGRDKTKLSYRRC